MESSKHIRLKTSYSLDKGEVSSKAIRRLSSAKISLQSLHIDVLYAETDAQNLSYAQAESV